VPESYGKRQKDAKKARKFAEREERRSLRKQQREDRAAGLTEDSWLADPLDIDREAPAPDRTEEAEEGSEPRP
jgi:hypothetical protein